MVASRSWRREGPSEDCGGIWAFNELQAGLADTFDAEEVTEYLADLPKVLTPASWHVAGAER